MRIISSVHNVAAACLAAALAFLLLNPPATLGDPGARTLVSGQPIPVGVGDRRGPLSAGISSVPIAAVRRPDSEGPDLFVAAGSHSSHPGLSRYRWLAMADSGAPVFQDRAAVKVPDGAGRTPAGTIFQTGDGATHGFWLVKGRLARTLFDETRLAFVETEARLELRDLPRSPHTMAVMPHRDGSFDLLLGITDGSPQRPTDVSSWRDPDYRPYDGAGVYRGGWPRTSLYAARLPTWSATSPVRVRRVSPTKRETLLSYGQITAVAIRSDDRRDVVTGSRFGNLLFYRNTSPETIVLAPHSLIVDRDGITMRHPTIRPTPIAYPNQQGRWSDLIAGGEGALYFYRFAGRFSERGGPAYDAPIPVLEQDAALYPGSLPVLSVADWNGDGRLDMISGNSEGRVLLLANAGDNRRPSFRPGEALEAGGEPIHIQPGYWGVQGPQESRWGYSCPTVVDWTEDGLLDIVMSSATARHEVFINRGVRGAPDLAPARPLYCDGLEMHGTWRVQPAVGRLGGRMAYIALDDDDQFHLYWKLDSYNLEDGGKLRLRDGAVLGANFLAAGGTGRLKLKLCDWDRDGRMDLLVGTPRHGSVPDPKTGLPQSAGLKGAAVLFLRNLGANDAPAFARPTLMRFRGEPIYLGQHACGPAPADFGDPDGPNLIVGDQEGRILYFARRDLSWESDLPLEEASRGGA